MIGASAAEKSVDLAGVGFGDDLFHREAASALAGLAFQQVALVGLLLNELSRTRHLEALLGAAVSLLLRHDGLFLLEVCAGLRV